MIRIVAAGLMVFLAAGEAEANFLLDLWHRLTGTEVPAAKLAPGAASKDEKTLPSIPTRAQEAFILHVTADMPDLVNPSGPARVFEGTLRCDLRLTGGFCAIPYFARWGHDVEEGHRDPIMPSRAAAAIKVGEKEIQGGRAALSLGLRAAPQVEGLYTVLIEGRGRYTEWRPRSHVAWHRAPAWDVEHKAAWADLWKGIEIPVYLMEGHDAGRPVGNDYKFVPGGAVRIRMELDSSAPGMAEALGGKAKTEARKK